MYIVLEVDLPTLFENIAINKDGKLSSIFDKIRADISISPEADFFDLFSEYVEKNQLKLSRYYYDYGSSSDDILNSFNDEAEDAINRVLEILQNRIDQFGVAEPTIQKQGNQRIIVELAGVQNSERARSLLESTALLEFYLVKDVTTTNELMIKIDQILKKDKSVASVAKELKSQETVSDETSSEQAVSVSELFGGVQSTDEADSAIEDEDIFAE